MRKLWFIAKGWIARQTLYMAIAPWVLPVLGGIVISTNLDLSSAWWIERSFWVGALLIALGSIPLAIRDSWFEREQKEIDDRKATERKALTLIASELSAINIPSELTATDEVEYYVYERMKLMLDAFVQEAYSDLLDPRVVFFMPGELGDRSCFFPVFVSKGTTRKPRIHLDDSSRYEGINHLLEGKADSQFENNVSGRSYTGYASTSIC